MPATVFGGVVSGVCAILWLGLLWYTAPLLSARRQPAEPVGAELVADRVRDAIVIGVAIPFVLGFLHLLYWPLLYGALAGCAYLRWRKHLADRVAAPSLYALPLAAVAAVAWPALAQPPLEGDTLAYHLPNALAWVHAHSVWTTGTRYWWYPGASELFAAGLIGAGGWWSAGLTGSVAAALLGLRIASWGEVLGTPRWVCGFVAAALICTPVAALQSGTMQNDLWLAAFFVESLWAVQRGGYEVVSALALTALVKPLGFVYATIAAACGRMRMTSALAVAFVPLGLWIWRDALLWREALIPPQSTAIPSFWATSIVAHGIEGLSALLAALWHAGVPTLAWLALAIGGLWVASARQTSLAGAFALLAFVAAPFGFAGSLPQLAGGASLRFALPAMAAGALVTCALGARVPVLVGLCSAIAVFDGARSVLAIFWNDQASRVALVLALAAIATAVAFADRRRALAGGAIACAAIVASAALGGARAVNFYDAWMRAPGGAKTTAFAWLRLRQPARLVTLDARAGAPGMIAPRTWVFDGVDASFCNEARRLRALLFVGTDRDVAPPVRVARFTSAKHCGRTVYEDRAAIVVDPLRR